jgi:hypothetical protein
MAKQDVLCRGLDASGVEKLATRGRPVVHLGGAAPFPVATVPMDAEWKARFDETDAVRAPKEPELAAARQRLVDGLLAFGGERALVWGHDEDLGRILARGLLLDGRRAVRMPGAPSRCHENSAECWVANLDRSVLMTGYALSDDGMWRQHSWLVEVRPRSTAVVETTEPRVAYFGFPMTEREAALFCDNNTDMGYLYEIPPAGQAPDDGGAAPGPRP